MSVMGIPRIFKLIILVCTVHFCTGTIDMNVQELQYLADHLHPEECRKLFASIHFKSYEEPNALDQAERKVPKDVPCLQMLIHWNSGVGEGRGESHEAIEHRLRQMGKYDLADWLGRTVFHQLGDDLQHSIDDPFEELAQDKEKKHKYVPVEKFDNVDNSDPSEWLAFDTICFFVVGALILITIAILFSVVWFLCCKKLKNRRNIRFSNKRDYRIVNRDTSDSGSESEERFDRRKALKERA